MSDDGILKIVSLFCLVQLRIKESMNSIQGLKIEIAFSLMAGFQSIWVVNREKYNDTLVLLRRISWYAFLRMVVVLRLFESERIIGESIFVVVTSIEVNPNLFLAYSVSSCPLYSAHINQQYTVSLCLKQSPLRV